VEEKINDEMEIDLREILHVLRQNVIVIILITLICGLLGYIYATYFIELIFQSETMIYVTNNSEEETVTYSDYQTSISLTKDYTIIVTSRPVMEQVIAELNLEYTVDELADMIQVEALTDTRMIEITVSNEDLFLAQEIANQVRDVASERITETMEVDSINLVQDASLPITSTNTSVRNYILICGFIGLFVSTGIILLLYFLDDSIKTKDDVEKYLGISLLGSIPKIEDSQSKKKKKKKHQKGE
jgi:capsular polysaccharide biosynthesis protein